MRHQHLIVFTVLLNVVVHSLAFAAPVFDDHGWRASSTVAKAEGIEREITPELLLKTELKAPVFLFDPTDG